MNLKHDLVKEGQGEDVVRLILPLAPDSEDFKIMHIRKSKGKTLLEKGLEKKLCND